jgi:hypothetical protein
MRRSVHLDDQSRFKRSEVDDKSSKNDLSSKAEARDLRTSKTLP